MAKQFSKWSGLEAYLKQIIQDELAKVGEQIRLALRMELQAKFYGRPGYHPNQEETEYYSRTWQLLESVSLSPTNVSGNSYSVRIFYDTDKIIPSYGEDGKWSPHQSIIDDRAFNEALPEVIEYGNPSPLYGWEPFNIVGDLTERLKDDKVVLQWFVKALEKKGFKCVVG
jgi:hypothetical protein